MKSKTFTIVILTALLIGACAPATTPAPPTPDVAAARTSAASTVISVFTLTAAAFTPTPEPPPTETSTPEPTPTDTQSPVAQITNPQGTSIPLCDSLTFDSATVDVNVPDLTVMAPGQDFVKTWRVKNDGTCPWGAGYGLVYAGYADRMSGQPQALPGVIAPGQEAEISVQFKAPDKPGEYTSAWQMANPKGIAFPKIIYVKITVK